MAGGGGQLGRELTRSCPAHWHCESRDRAALDIADAVEVAAALDDLQPKVFINAAAYTAVDGAESHIEAAHRGNAEGPAVLAAACAERGIRLIHVSTDFVFRGDAGRPYRPDDTPQPLGEYGRSKLAGEQAVRTALPGALIVRTAWVYSAFGGNFVKTMLRLMAERDQVGVVADQIGTPTWAAGLAAALWTAADRDVSGIYHWSDAGVCSWYDFACAIMEEALSLGMLPHEVAVAPLTTADYPTPAARPAYSVLDKTRSWADLALEPVHWRRRLRQMLQDLKELENG